MYPGMCREERVYRVVYARVVCGRSTLRRVIPLFLEEKEETLRRGFPPIIINIIVKTVKTVNLSLTGLSCQAVKTVTSSLPGFSECPSYR